MEIHFKKLNILIALLLVAVYYISCSTNQIKKDSRDESPAQAKNEITQTPPQGKNIYIIYCQMCHGEDGKQVLIGDYDLVLSQLNLKEIVEVVTSGRKTMTSYKTILQEEEIQAVAAYIIKMQQRN